MGSPSGARRRLGGLQSPIPTVSQQDPASSGPAGAIYFPLAPQHGAPRLTSFIAGRQSQLAPNIMPVVPAPPDRSKSPSWGAAARRSGDGDSTGRLAGGLGLRSSLAEVGGAQRDRQAVLDLADTRRRPRRAFRNVTLVPGLDFASEDHPSTVGLDGDPRSIDLGTPLQRPLDLLLDL